MSGFGFAHLCFATSYWKAWLTPRAGQGRQRRRAERGFTLDQFAARAMMPLRGCKAASCRHALDTAWYARHSAQAAKAAPKIEPLTTRYAPSALRSALGPRGRYGAVARCGGVPSPFPRPTPPILSSPQRAPQNPTSCQMSRFELGNGGQTHRLDTQAKSGLPSEVFQA